GPRRAVIVQILCRIKHPGHVDHYFFADLIVAERRGHPRSRSRVWRVTAPPRQTRERLSRGVLRWMIERLGELSCGMAARPDRSLGNVEGLGDLSVAQPF